MSLWFEAHPALVCLAIFPGMLAGILSSLFGIGGGVIMIPMLRLLFGLPPVATAATSLAAIFPTSLSGLFNRRNDGTINWRVGLTVGICGAFISPIGAALATNLPGWIAMVVSSCFIAFVATKLLIKARRTTLAMRGEVSESPMDTPKAEHGKLYHCAAPLAVGVIAGFMSGYLGLGGGFIIVPILMKAFDMNIKQATGTSLLAVGILGVPGLITHAYYGNIQWLLTFFLVLGSIPGTKIGAMINKRLSMLNLTYLFAITLLISGIILVIKEFV